MGAAPTRRAPCPACGATGCDQRRPARQLAGPRAAGPSGTRSDGAATPSRGCELTSPFQDLTQGRPTRARTATGPAKTPAGNRGCPRGSSKRRPSTQPRTVARERAQYGRPTVRAFDLASAIASSRHGVKGAPPTKATPAPMPGVTATGGAQPRGTVRVSGRSPTGAGRRSPATPPPSVRSNGDRSPDLDRRHPEGEGSWPVGSSPTTCLRYHLLTWWARLPDAGRWSRQMNDCPTIRISPPPQTAALTSSRQRRRRSWNGVVRSAP